MEERGWFTYIYNIACVAVLQLPAAASRAAGALLNGVAASRAANWAHAAAQVARC